MIHSSSLFSREILHTHFSNKSMYERTFTLFLSNPFIYKLNFITCSYRWVTVIQLFIIVHSSVGWLFYIAKWKYIDFYLISEWHSASLKLSAWRCGKSWPIKRWRWGFHREITYLVKLSETLEKMTLSVDKILVYTAKTGLS